MAKYYENISNLQTNSRTLDASSRNQQVSTSLKGLPQNSSGGLVSESPGPGQYETYAHTSIGGSEHLKRAKANASRTAYQTLQNSSQGLDQKQPLAIGFGSGANREGQKGSVYHNHSVKKLNNLAIPSIPSRFLTPILKFDFHEKDLTNYDHVITSVPGGGHPKQREQVTESETILLARVARLTNDGSNVGPASYNVDKSFKALNHSSPKVANNYAIDNSRRMQNTVPCSTNEQIGPGAYKIELKYDKGIDRPTVARSDWKNSRMNTTIVKRRVKNKGSIRADYETDSSEEEHLASPGPGHFLKHYHASTMRSQSIIHDHPQQFGFLEQRFREGP